MARTLGAKKLYVLIAVLGLLYIYVHKVIIGNLGIRHLWGSSLGFHLATVCKLFGYQFFLIFLPSNFSPTRDFTVVNQWTDIGFYFGLILFVSFVGLFFIFRKQKKVCFIIAAYLIFWFPVSNFIPAEGLIADRYLYELTMIVGIAIAMACSKLKTFPKFLIPIFIVMGICAWVQSLSWVSEKYLWSHAIQTSPSSSVAWNQWGNVLLLDRQYLEANQAYSQAFRLNSKYREASLNRAMVPYETGHEPEALLFVQQHLTQFPADDEAYDLLGAIYEKNSDYEHSISESKKSH